MRACVSALVTSAHLLAPQVVPIYFSTIVLVSTCSGGIYFGELGGLGAGAAVGLTLGVLLALCGVYLLTSGPEKEGLEAEAEEYLKQLDDRSASPTSDARISLRGHRTEDRHL